jgi:hypothetical protein
MAGLIPLSGLQLGVETTAGTPVATTRELYPSPTGYLDPGLTITRHEGVQRGTYTNIESGTVLSYLPTIGFSSESSIGVAFDELPIIMSQMESGLSGTGTGADKTWSTTAGSTTATFDTYTFNVFDNTQAYEFAYGVATGFSLSGGYDDMTQYSMDWVGKQLSKVTADSVSGNTALKIPSSLWTIKYAAAQASLTGASELANTLRSWDLSVTLPPQPRFYADGNQVFGQVLASNNLTGTLTMTWDSTADAVTQYDNFVAQTKSFIRLKATGAALGGSNYDAQIDVCVLWDPVQPMASDSDNVTEYSLTGHLTYDSTWDASIGMDVVCSIAALP